MADTDTATATHGSTATTHPRKLSTLHNPHTPPPPPTTTATDQSPAKPPPKTPDQAATKHEHEHEHEHSPAPTPHTPRLDRLPRPTKTHELKAKLRSTTRRDDTSAQEAQRRQLNNERNRRARQRKIEREIASGVRHKDGRVRRSRERPWC